MLTLTRISEQYRGAFLVRPNTCFHVQTVFICALAVNKLQQGGVPHSFTIAVK